MDELESAALWGVTKAYFTWKRGAGSEWQTWYRARIHWEVAERQRRGLHDTRSHWGSEDLRVRLDAPAGIADNDAWHDVIPDPRVDVAQEVLAQLEWEEIAAAMARLPQRERYVLEQSFLHERCLADVGRDLGVSMSRAQQLRQSALFQLQDGLELPRVKMPRQSRNQPDSRRQLAP